MDINTKNKKNQAINNLDNMSTINKYNIGDIHTNNNKTNNINDHDNIENVISNEKYISEIQNILKKHNKYTNILDQNLHTERSKNTESIQSKINLYEKKIDDWGILILDNLDKLFLKIEKNLRIRIKKGVEDKRIKDLELKERLLAEKIETQRYVLIFMYTCV
jgi:hypothetical protein